MATTHCLTCKKLLAKLKCNPCGTKNWLLQKKIHTGQYENMIKNKLKVTGANFHHCVLDPKMVMKMYRYICVCACV